MKLAMCYTLSYVTEYEGRVSIQIAGTYMGLDAAKKAGTKADYWYFDTENKCYIGYDDEHSQVHYIITETDAYFD
jgi:hypothetical protein